MSGPGALIYLNRAHACEKDAARDVTWEAIDEAALIGAALLSCRQARGRSVPAQRTPHPRALSANGQNPASGKKEQNAMFHMDFYRRRKFQLLGGFA
jgi:hypothetical protein